MLQTTHEPGEGDLVAVDGMAVTLPKTQRHGCRKVNNKTVGGGVVWAYMIKATRGICPIKVLRIVEGAWHDSKAMGGVSLVANGPTYLMDRGFYAFELLEQWLGQQIRFIVRVRERSLNYSVVASVSSPRPVGSKYLTLDAIVTLGAPRAKLHPQVRLIIARLASGENLILATDRLDWSAELVLENYAKRWHIERFHRFLKDALGLAHLYSFQQSGISLLIYTALLTALLMLLGVDNPNGQTTVRILYRLLAQLRHILGLTTPWKRNSCKGARARKRATKLSKTAER